MEIKIFQTIEELNAFAAGKFIEIGNEAIEKRGLFTVVLAGGSTPKSLYQLLSSDKYKNKINWNSVFFFFGDERDVLPDDEQSNFRMANENLFLPLHIAGTNIFRWKTELGNETDIAEDYEQNLKEFFKLPDNEMPKFNLILLGMGDDGHTASLFPFTKALNENKKFAARNQVEKLDRWRFTLTFPVINNAENIMFLVKGEDKSETLKYVIEGEFEPEKFPSQKVKPENGRLFWLIDQSAARLLNKTDV